MSSPAHLGPVPLNRRTGVIAGAVVLLLYLVSRCGGSDAASPPVAATPPAAVATSTAPVLRTSLPTTAPVPLLGAPADTSDAAPTTTVRPRATTAAPVRTSTRAVPAPDPDPDPDPAVAAPRSRSSDSADDGGGAAYYPNCTAARAAGAAPMNRGEPGYRSALDRDDDGIACD